MRWLAEESGVAILNNSHLNKAQGLGAIQKVIGSMAVVAIHRMAWAFSSSPDNRDEHLAVPLKHNITANLDGMRFSVETVKVRLDDGTECPQPRIVYEGATQVTAEDAIGMTMEQKTQLECVIDILQEELGDHEPRDNKPITQRIKAEIQDCSTSLISKARKALGVQSRKVGKTWQWTLPEPSTLGDCHSIPPPESQISCASCAT